MSKAKSKQDPGKCKLIRGVHETKPNIFEYDRAMSLYLIARNRGVEHLNLHPKPVRNV